LRTRGIGHAGTLDPMATGLLVLAVGEGRKVLRYLALDDKRYDATLRLGVETDSLDADGSVVGEAPVPESALVPARVVAALAAFIGTIEQRAPVVSAIKQGGVALHRRARRGEQVQAPVRHVLCHGLELMAVRPQTRELDLRVHCGKGFYVRALARDLASELGTVGHLGALRRTHSGHFAVDDAVDIERVREAAESDEVRSRVLRGMLALERALPHAPKIVVDAVGAEHARHGRAIPRACMAAGEVPAAGTEPVLVVSEAGVPLTLARADDECLRVVRGLNVG
jgi:tRNA pseudouridine55 synthase